MLGSLAIAVVQTGLESETRLDLVVSTYPIVRKDDHIDMPQAATDIGRVVTAIYKVRSSGRYIQLGFPLTDPQNFGECHGEELALISDSLTSAQIGHDHAQAIGSWFSYMWWPLARLVLAINPETQKLFVSTPCEF